MSLILEALRKLERDKDAPERGFVVMTHVPWAQGGSRSRLLGVGALALAVAVGTLTVALWWSRAPKPAAIPEPRAVVTVPPSPPPQAAPVTPPTSPPFEARALAMESLRQVVATPAPASATATAPRPSSSASQELKLNAISQQDGKPVAILNDRLVREGDVFDGIRVIRIGEIDVEVEVRGQRRVLRF